MENFPAHNKNQVFAVSVTSTDVGWIDELIRRREMQPGLTTIVLSSQKFQTQIADALNRGLIDFVIDSSASRLEVEEGFAAASQLALDRERSHSDLLRARDQNRQLERLTRGLEDVVRERTQTAANSKAEVERRLGLLREILRFMQELNQAASPEDVLALLRRELKIYHRLRDPILAFCSGSGDRRLAYFRSGHIFERRTQKPWPQSLRIRQNDPMDSQYLANEFGRPVGRVVAIPLMVRKAEGDQHPQPTLFFEHEFTSTEADEFLTRIGERLQIVTMGLDRLLLEYDLRSAAYLWEHTFDGLEDPIAIVDVDSRVMRNNRAFANANLTGSDPGKGLLKRDADVFAVHSYPISDGTSGEPTTHVIHYQNVTESLALQERVVQTEKMAALGHLAGHIAHELNNPLTGIRALAQVWLGQPNVSETVKQDLREVEKAAERSQGIITNLLQFTRGGQSEKIHNVDLNDVIKHTLPLLKTALSEHRFELSLVDKPCWVKGDAHLLQQVTFNLLKNACQAVHGKGELGLSVLESKDKSHWEMHISDNGAGIEPTRLDSLFTPFYTTKAEGEGTGLGLSLSRSIIRRFGGEISVSSEPGKGSEFTVKLPKGSAS